MRIPWFIQDLTESVLHPLQSRRARRIWARTLAKTTTVTLHEQTYMSYENALRSHAVVRIHQPAQVETARQVLSISRVRSGYCLCYGDISVRLESADGEVLAQVQLHHRRTSGLVWQKYDFGGEMVIDDTPALNAWLRHHGFTVTDD